MAMRVTDGARRDALVSRVSRLRRSRARALPSLNLKEKKDCSQWFGSHFNVGVTLRLLLSARVSSLVIFYLLIFELTVINNDKGRNSIVPLVQSMPPVDWTSLQTVPRGVTLNDDHSVKTKRTRQYPARIWMYMQSNLKQSQNQAEKLIRNFQTSNAKLASGPVKWTHS